MTELNGIVTDDFAELEIYSDSQEVRAYFIFFKHFNYFLIFFDFKTWDWEDWRTSHTSIHW